MGILNSKSMAELFLFKKLYLSWLLHSIQHSCQPHVFTVTNAASQSSDSQYVHHAHGIRSDGVWTYSNCCHTLRYTVIAIVDRTITSLQIECFTFLCVGWVLARIMILQSWYDTILQVFLRYITSDDSDNSSWPQGIFVNICFFKLRSIL